MNRRNRTRPCLLICLIDNSPPLTPVPSFCIIYIDRSREKRNRSFNCSIRRKSLVSLHLNELLKFCVGENTRKLSCKRALQTRKDTKYRINNNRGLWFRGRESQDLACEYVLLGEHTPRYVMLHWETNKVAVGFDGGVFVRKLGRDATSRCTLCKETLPNWHGELYPEFHCAHTASQHINRPHHIQADPLSASIKSATGARFFCEK